YNSYRKENKKSFKKNKFHAANWAYSEEDDTYTCPNGKRLSFKFVSHRTDRTGFKREIKVYECEDCSDCPLRAQCTKAKDGNNRKVYYNEKWEQQKNQIKQQLSEEKTGSIYAQRKIDVEPVFGYLKANLRFNRMSVRGKDRVENELGFAFMAVNLKKYTAMNT
ncbi:transposase, partial [Bacillus sp. SJS]|uniref:transposase n=1 Tax=Bacillus sp. SJS TaxID=1423321 RepID=UPI0004DD79D6